MESPVSQLSSGCRSFAILSWLLGGLKQLSMQVGSIVTRSKLSQACAMITALTPGESWIFTWPLGSGCQACAVLGETAFFHSGSRKEQIAFLSWVNHYSTHRYNHCRLWLLWCCFV